MLFRKNKPAVNPGPVEFLIAGLGNPGKTYEGTRHNAGFAALEALAEKLDVRVDRVRFQSFCGEGRVGDRKVLLMMPQTFMNLSGEAVRDAMQFYKLPPERCLILFDDISLPVGVIRVRRKGSDGGHNGMKNIIYLSGKDTFPRIKLGIGAKPNPGWDLADWVLSRFTEQEQKQLSDVFDHAAEAVALMVNGNSTEAMNRFNGA